MSCCLLLLQRTKLGLIKRGEFSSIDLLREGEYKGEHDEAKKEARRTIFTLTPQLLMR